MELEITEEISLSMTMSTEFYTLKIDEVRYDVELTTYDDGVEAEFKMMDGTGAEVISIQLEEIVRNAIADKVW